MKKLLLAGSITSAALISTAALAQDEGEFTVKGVYGDMRFEQDGMATSGFDEDKNKRQDQGSLELKYETDQYFLKGSHTRTGSFDIYTGTGTEGGDFDGDSLNNNLKSRQTEVEFGYKAFANDWVTLSPTAGLREYKTTIGSTVNETDLPSNSQRWTEVFVGAQADVQWLGNNTLTANYQHAINNGNSRKAFIENNYRFDMGLNLGIGYKWHDYEVNGSSMLDTTVDESGGYLSVGYTF